MIAPRYRDCEDLEGYLGDPDAQGNPLSLAASRELDEDDASREPFMRLLWNWGYARHYVPAAYGGSLCDASNALALLRCVARRDITTAHQLGNNLLGALPVWIGGTDEQKGMLALRLLGRQRAAFALTERGHGADVLSNEVTATPAPGGYRLDGEKWLISQAATSDVVSVMARTGNAGDARGFTMFLLKKDSVPPGGVCPLPREATLGLRGADISGLRLDGCFVDEGARVGEPGEALDLTLKTLSVSKIFVSGLSLAATDTGLRTVLDFALERKLYGSPVAGIPHAKAALAGAFADLLLADACATFAARALSVVPGQASVLGNIVKVAVPRVCERALHELAAILGARFYLRNHENGVFQKMMRDQAIVRVFDGNSIVCLNAISSQLGPLLSRPGRRSDGDADAAYSRVKQIATLGEAVPTLDFSAVRLHSRGVDDLVQSLPDTLSRMTPGGANGLLEIGRDCLTRTARLPGKIEAVRDALGPAAPRSREMYDLAEEYTSIALAGAGLHFRQHNTEEPAGFLARGDWLVLAAERALNRSFLEIGARQRAIDNVFSELLRRHRSCEMFSLVPVQLAAKDSSGAALAGSGWESPASA